MIETQPFELPSLVETTIHNFWTCEFSTISKSGAPVTWPVFPIYLAKKGQFLVFSPIGFPQKVLNARRNPRVSLFYSDPTGSGLTSPARVLIQGDAESPDEIFVSPRGQDKEIVAELKAQAKRLMHTQPGISQYMGVPMMRWLMDWYFMRLVIFITPRWIRWWPLGGPGDQSQLLEIPHVAAN
jgi:hypothetical protein